jgi:hypothetical protein
LTDITLCIGFKIIGISGGRPKLSVVDWRVESGKEQLVKFDGCCIWLLWKKFIEGKWE